MSTQYARAPHFREGALGVQAPNAALLIDFDNVTMGMRSDLSKDLKKLLSSDVIRGKVTVQRAYADWRRYPQYIVPLSENSIDLIFAPAYGSSKKNATDIRMAIDGMELIFTRPEIGTYILLTGDSDFSSLVLKLKEYGKYVIGVGIQESSSDILVQNCDEYYSYTNLAGLTKTTETDVKSVDPWVLVEKAVRKMKDRGDVMRSDRLKQVMIEIDSTFDEGSYGFSKFSKFVTEAASRKLLELKKMPNGQYEIVAGKKSGGAAKDDEDRGGRRSRRGRNGRDGDEPRGRGRAEKDAAAPSEKKDAEAPATGDGVEAAYDVLRQALERLKDDGRHPVRDSDVKRRILEIDPDFDEGELGFGKFSRFLRQAHDQEVIDLTKQDGGSYEVALREAGSRPATEAKAVVVEAEDAPAEVAEPEAPAAEVPSGPVVEELKPQDFIAEDAGGRRLGPRGGTTRRRGGDDPPPLFEGQGRPSAAQTPSLFDEGADGSESEAARAFDPATVDLATLDLPTETDRVVRYLTHYKGVGEKTARQFAEHFGDQVFHVLHERPEAAREVVPASRAEQLVAGWQEDLRRRAAGEEPNEGRARRGRRSRGRRGGRSGRGERKD